MKNLPDKIYLNFGEITEEEFETDDYKEFCKLDEFAVTFSEDRVYDTDVEYVRKDTFIEKAWDWIEDNMLSSNQQCKSLLYYEQFKKYLEK